MENTKEISKMTITRTEAIRVLRRLEECGILNEELENGVADILRCIDAERDGLHIWGAEDEWVKLYIAYREDLWTPELKAELQAINDKYSFVPAPYEAEKLEED